MKNSSWFCRGVHVRVLLTFVVALVYGAGVVSSVAAQSDPAVDVLDKEGVFGPDSDDSDVFSMIITMQGKGEEGLKEHYSFEAHLLDEENEPQATREGRLYRYGMVLGSNVAQFKATVPITELSSTGMLSGTLTGYLIVRDGDRIVGSEALPITVKPKVAPMKAFGLVMMGFTDVLLFGLAFALLWLVVCFYVLCHKYQGNWRDIPGGDIGALTWKFSENWVANFTGATGIAVVILGLKFTMETTKLNIKVGEYALLGAIFALGSTAFAGAIGAIVTSFFPKKDRPGATRVWIYLFVVSVIIWGSVGAMMTAALFMDEARLGLHLDKTTVFVLQVLILVLAVGALIYAIRKTSDIVVQKLVQRTQQKALSALGDALRLALERLNKGEDLKPVVEGFKNDETIERWAWTLESLRGSLPEHSVENARKLLLRKLEQCTSDDKLRARGLLAVALGNVTDVSKALTKLLRTPEDVDLAVGLQQAVTSMYTGIDLAKREGLDAMDPKSAKREVNRLAQDSYDRWEAFEAAGDAGTAPPIYLP